MKRRALLTALPAVAAAGIPAVADEVNAAVSEALAAAETPVAAMFREWQVTMADLEQEDGDTPSPEWRAVSDHLNAIEARMFAEPVTGWADMAMKLCIATGFGVWDMNQEAELWAEARALVGVAA